MHVPDHMLNDPTSAATGVVACAAIAYAAYRSRENLSSDRVALTAATGAVVFALQMVNYPVATGTSGHLMGGVLAAALVGPWLAMIAVTLVLAVQATLFADGGLTALGTNTVLMAVVGVAVGWAVMRGARRAVRGMRSSGGVRALAPLTAAAGLGAFASVVASSLVVVGLFAAGGAVAVPLGELTATMVPVHVLIGLGEGVLTTGVVAIVLVVAPGVAQIDMQRVGARSSAHGQIQGSAEVPVRRAVGVLSGIAGLSAVVLSSFAAASPDGLEATAEQLGFLDSAGAHALASLPFADYGAASGSPVGAAGLLGVVVVAALAAAVLWGMRTTATCAR